MNVAIRLDISSDIGMGHYIRMSALADALKTLGCMYTFYTNKDEPIDYTGFDIVILDTYQINDEYITNLRTSNRLLVCYDDNALYTYCCDILLNANFHATELEFKFYGKPPKFLLGSHYALLRREFWEAEPISIKKNANQVFLCFGGSDVNNFSPRAIKALNRIPNVNLTIILGAYTRCDREVIALKTDNVKIIKNPLHISHTMMNCDIAVAAAGSMVYELAALGIPSIVISQADNQHKIAQYLEQNKLMKWLGDWDSVSPEELQRQVEDLLDDVLRRKMESKQISKIIDRKGALNAAKIILETSNEYLTKNR